MKEAGASEWKEGAEGRGKRPNRAQTPTLTSSATPGKFSVIETGLYLLRAWHHGRGTLGRKRSPTLSSRGD